MSTDMPGLTVILMFQNSEVINNSNVLILIISLLAC